MFYFVLLSDGKSYIFQYEGTSPFNFMFRTAAAELPVWEGFRAMAKRVFHFLQGPRSPFFARLAAALIAAGHAVEKINFCGGDRVFWPHREAWDFAGRREELADFTCEKFRRHGITDLVLLSDCRRIHGIVMGVARRFGARIHVFEEGYIRPNWITLEEGGVNGYSALPREPKWYRDMGRQISDQGDGVSVGRVRGRHILYDVLYNAAALALRRRYPRYRSHRPYPVRVVYAANLRRFARLPAERARADQIQSTILAAGRPYYLFPLQVDSDSQLRVHSSYGGMSSAIEAVVTSFAATAPGDRLLLLKNHPLDDAVVDLRRIAFQAARRHGVAERLVFFDGGDLDALLRHASGVVTVNSTTGFAALAHGRPLIALGRAVFDLPGLTFQGSLDAFWRNGEPPDAALFRAFRRCVIHFTQVNGGFYTERGMALAVAGAVRRLVGERAETTVLRRTGMRPIDAPRRHQISPAAAADRAAAPLA